MNYKKELQEAILYQMNVKGVKQIDLARELGVSKQAVQIFLKTKNVSYDKLFDLANMFDLEVYIEIHQKENI